MLAYQNIYMLKYFNVFHAYLIQRGAWHHIYPGIMNPTRWLVLPGACESWLIDWQNILLISHLLIMLKVQYIISITLPPILPFRFLSVLPPSLAVLHNGVIFSEILNNGSQWSVTWHHKAGILHHRTGGQCK